MKYLATAVMICGSMAMQSALGDTGVTANNLYLGFQNEGGGGTRDYIINLGPAANILGKSTNVDLSADFLISYFNVVLGSASSMYGGVVGGSNAGNPSGIYLTQLRSGGAGNPATAGSSVPTTLSVFADNTAYSDLTGFSTNPPAGSGALDTTKSWETYVEAFPNPQVGSTFWSDTGVNPDSAVNKTTVLYEDLWHTSSSGTAKPFVYQGYFTLDLTGSSPKLTFTSTNVPAQLSRPMVVSINKSGNTVTLVSSNALASHTYTLLYTTSLSPTSWVTNMASAVSATGTFVTNSDTSATDQQRFYKVQAQ